MLLTVHLVYIVVQTGKYTLERGFKQNPISFTTLTGARKLRGSGSTVCPGSSDPPEKIS